MKRHKLNIKKLEFPNTIRKTCYLYQVHSDPYHKIRIKNWERFVRMWQYGSFSHISAEDSQFCSLPKLLIWTKGSNEVGSSYINLTIFSTTLHKQ